MAEILFPSISGQVQPEFFFFFLLNLDICSTMQPMSSTGLLHISTADVWGRMILGGGGCAVHCRTFK